MMKIAFWHFYTFRMHRGIETLVVALANALAKKGIATSIITANPTIKSLVTPDPKVSVYAFPTGRFYEHKVIVPFYACHFLRHRYDHVVTFFADFGEGAAVRLLSPFIELPLSIYLCYPYSAVPHRYESFLRRGWAQSAKHIVADAEWVAKEAENLFRRSVPIVPVGTDPERFRPDPERRRKYRSRLGFTDNDLVLLNVSALERRKGVWRVIESLARLRGKLPQLRYLILGQGEDSERLQREVKDSGLDNVVTFGGVTSELEGFYNAADTFVMLPDAEANSVACHEAMSSGLPVVVSGSGGFNESVPTNAGMLVNPDAPDEIDDALTRLAADGELRRSLGQQGRQHITEHYTWDRIADRFTSILGRSK